MRPARCHQKVERAKGGKGPACQDSSIQIRKPLFVGPAVFARKPPRQRSFCLKNTWRISNQETSGGKGLFDRSRGGRGRKKMASSSSSSSSDFFSPSPIHYSARERPGKKRKKPTADADFPPFHFRDNNCPGEKLLRKKNKKDMGKDIQYVSYLEREKELSKQRPYYGWRPLVSFSYPSHINTFMRGGKAKTTQTRSLGLFFLEKKSWDSPIILKQFHRTIVNLTNNIGFPNSKHWNFYVESRPRSTVAECSSWLVLMCLVTRETSVGKRASLLLLLLLLLCPWH